MMQTRSAHPLSLFAFPGSILYGAAVQLRTALYGRGILRTRRLRQPVLSIGNLTAGGTGKTPIVEALGRRLLAKGCAVSILSRGYRRSSRGVVAVSRGQGPLADPFICGDEPFLLARNLPGSWVTVGEDRYAAGRSAEAGNSNCIHLLDDAYQHLRLHRDCNILILDATDPFGGEKLLPAGRLREPLTAMARADLIIVTRADRPFEEQDLIRQIRKYNPRAPIAYSHNQVCSLIDIQTGVARPPSHLHRKKVVAFAGIGKPEIFFEDLAHCQIDMVIRRAFPDHHRYRREEIGELFQAARLAGAEAVVTTEKDEVNLRPALTPGVPIYYLRIEARFAREAEIDFWLENALPEVTLVSKT